MPVSDYHTECRGGCLLRRYQSSLIVPETETNDRKLCSVLLMIIWLTILCSLHHHDAPVAMLSLLVEGRGPYQRLFPTSQVDSYLQISQIHPCWDIWGTCITRSISKRLVHNMTLGPLALWVSQKKLTSQILDVQFLNLSSTEHIPCVH